MAVWNGLGMGMGVPTSTWTDFINNPTGYDSWLLKVLGKFPKVRIIADGDYANSITASRLLVNRVKALSPSTEILYGISSNVTFTSVTIDDYLPIAVAEATWAQANGVTRFQFANEFDGRHNGSMTDANMRDKLKSWVDDLEAVFSGELSVAIAQGKEDGWISDTKGTIHKLSFNLYGNLVEASTLSVFKGYCDEVFAAFGTDCFISEWNASYDWDSFTIGGKSYNQTGFDAGLTRELKKRLAIIQNSGIEEAYFFHAWSFSSSFGVDYFALLSTDGGARTYYNRLLGIRDTHIILQG